MGPLISGFSRLVNYYTRYLCLQSHLNMRRMCERVNYYHLARWYIYPHENQKSQPFHGSVNIPIPWIRITMSFHRVVSADLNDKGIKGLPKKSLGNGDLLDKKPTEFFRSLPRCFPCLTRSFCLYVGITY